MSPCGLFVGLVTLDLVYQVADLPAANQKIVALDHMVAAGGPATNAAVAFRHLGGRAIALGMVGAHPITHLIQADLQQCGVRLIDLEPCRPDPPPVSSILVTAATGDRTVVSLNAVKRQATPEQLPADLLNDVQIVLIDGHQLAVSRAIAAQARQRHIPVVLDGGSWKPGLETVLPLVDYAICSANFRPPRCQQVPDVFAYLQAQGIGHIAITQGGQPIRYAERASDIRYLDVPTIQALDTLGAGDIFHGAFCSYIVQMDFAASLAQSAQVAAYACQSFGTRQWLSGSPFGP